MSDGWCQDDPIVRIGSDVYSITVLVPQKYQDSTDFVLHVLVVRGHDWEILQETNPLTPLVVKTRFEVVEPWIGPVVSAYTAYVGESEEEIEMITLVSKYDYVRYTTLRPKEDDDPDDDEEDDEYDGSEEEYYKDEDEEDDEDEDEEEDS